MFILAWLSAAIIASNGVTVPGWVTITLTVLAIAQFILKTIVVGDDLTRIWFRK